jgi:hypothetical protein
MNLIDTSQSAFNQKPCYRVTAGDWMCGSGHAHSLAAHRFLRDLVSYRRRLVELCGDEKLPNTWLLQFRDDFRRLLNDETVLVVNSFMLVGDRNLQPVFIWLMRRYANRFRLCDIDEFCDDASPAVRKHAAKALRRLEAWPALGDMLRAYPDDKKVRWFATAPIRKRTSRESLEKYSESIEQSHAHEVVTPSRMPFWRRESFWERTPPKSVLAIRRMLRRIRHLVRWNVRY